MIKRVNIYALYKGDKNLIDGTIQFYNSNIYKNKIIKKRL